MRSLARLARGGLGADNHASPFLPSSSPAEVSANNAFRNHCVGHLVDRDLEEHHAIKQLAYKADTSMYATDPQAYDDVLNAAVQAFVAHADEEERDQLPLLTAKLSTEENDAEARKFLAARKAAPERPHPLAPQSGGLLHQAAALQSKVHDKILTSLQGRQYVDDFKYQTGPPSAPERHPPHVLRSPATGRPTDQHPM